MNTGRHIQWNDFAGRLANYKAIHADRARKAGTLDRLNAARTLTAARKVVFGDKDHERLAKQVNNTASSNPQSDSRPMRARGSNKWKRK